MEMEFIADTYDDLESECVETILDNASNLDVEEALELFKQIFDKVSDLWVTAAESYIRDMVSSIDDDSTITQLSKDFIHADANKFAMYAQDIRDMSE